MNKARLEWHRKRHADTSEYIRAKNEQAMREWLEVWANIDRNDPAVLESHGRDCGERGMKLVNAARVLDGDRREGALKRAGRFLREEHALFARASRLRAGEKPLDEWARCSCGAAFRPGERGYTVCWNCSSKEWYQTSWTCVFCSRRHSMSFPLCFPCRVHDGRSEDDARFLRLMVNRRDDYTCQMCGLDAMVSGAELQVDRINPELPSDPWNLQTLCVSCCALKGKHYDKHDEREYWKLVAAYWGPLYDYLSPDEISRLSRVEPDDEGGMTQIDFGHRPTWRTDDECDEEEGMLNVVAALGPVGITFCPIDPELMRLVTG